MAQLCAVTGNIADLGLEPVPNSTAVLRPVREGTSVVVGGDVVTLARKPVDISDDGAVAFDAVTAAYFLDVATPTSFTSIRLGVPDAASAVLSTIANTTPPPPLDAAQIALQGAQEARDEAVEAAGEVAEAFEGLDEAITAIGGIENLSSAVTSAANSATAAELARMAAQTAAGEAQVAKITWRGNWATSTAYVARDAVARNGTSYVVKQDHTSGVTSDPGSGANWTDFWDVLALKGDQGDPGPAGAGSGDVFGPASATNNHIVLFDGTTGKLLKGAGVGIDGFGDVVGPASSTNNHVAVFDGAGGKLLKGAGVSVADLATAAQGAKADTALQPGAQIPWADVTGKPVFFDGTWASLSGKPATFPPAAHTHTATDVTGLATVATSGAYADLSGLPTLFSGSYGDLTDKPTLFSGAYADLTGIPATFAPAAHNQAWSTITSTPTTLAGFGITDAAPLSHVGAGGTAHAAASTTVAGFMSAADKVKLNGVAPGATANTGTVTSVSGTGTASGLTLSGTVTGAGSLTLSGTVTPAWADVTGKPIFADVATSGAYADLSGRPTLGTAAALNVGTTAGTVAAGNDSRLSDAREWTATTIAQAEAEAGTATTRRAWTAQRVRQAIAAWWAGSSDKTKLDGIATGATANATDAALRNRATHTGTQAISTVTGLQAALDGRVTQPYANRAAAVAALPTLPAAVTRIGWYDGNVLLEVVKAPGAGLLPDLADWVPAGDHRLQHWGIAVHTTTTAARATVAAMTAGQRTAHQAALASAFGGAVGRLVLDGWVEALDHIVINPYRIVDMSVPVDQAGITVASSRFNLSAEAIVSGGTSVRGCIIEKLHISCEQPSTLTRGTVVAYPPAFIPRGDFGRCEYMRIALANAGIGEASGGANNGGWTFGRVEISAFDRPFNFEGDLHHVTVTDMIDVWVYGMNASQQAVAYDGNTPFARIGRMDGFSAAAVKIFRQCGLEIDSDPDGATGGLNEGIPVMIDRFAGDGDGAGLHFKSGRSLISVGYGTEGAAAPQLPWKVLCEGGDHTVHGYDFIGDALAAVKVTGGHLRMVSPSLYNTNNSVGQLARVEGGELTLISPRLRWPNGVRSLPAIEQVGAGAVLRVIDPIVDPSITTGTEVVKFNNDNAGNVLRAETIAPHAAEFNTAWTLGWYKASGVTSPRSRLQDTLVIDNGAADGGNIVLRSAGNPSWEVDNLNGQLRFVRDGVARIGLTDTTASVNLQVTGTAVTQSAIDATAGRLTRVGDFGLGTTSSSPNCPDLDSFDLAAGTYNILSSTPNVTSRPVGSSSFATIKVHRYSSLICWQVYYDRADASGVLGEVKRTWIRGCAQVSPGVRQWGPWTLQYSQANILLPVTQSGGVPTGGLIQRGSTANGQFTKYADGTMECWHTQNSSSAGAATWTFPTDVPFVGAVNVQVTPASTVFRTATVAATATPQLTADFRCFDSAGALATVGCNLFAKGRWF